MINKILWATDGSNDSIEALKYAELLSKKYNVTIQGITILPKDNKLFDTLSPEEKKKFKDNIFNILESKNKKSLDNIKAELTRNGVEFSYTIEEGVPYQEIINAAQKENADLIALGKGRSVEKFILGGTVLKVLRNCTIPVLTAGENSTKSSFHRILVPIDLLHGLTLNYNYALELSEAYNSEIILAHIVETSEHAFSEELKGKIKSSNREELEYMLSKANRGKGVKVLVETARNAWLGITKIEKENDIDLIVMMTYGGKDIKKEFIGSITWKVIQESSVPVITLTPKRTIMKMTGDVK